MKHRFTRKMQEALAHYANDPDRDKTAAYRSAYGCENMQAQTVRRKAQELFAHPLMAQGVRTVQGVALQQVGVDAAWVYKKLALLASFNIKRFIRLDDGKPSYDFSEATEDDWYCLSELDIENIGPLTKTKAKSESKLRALKLLGDHTDVQAFRENIAVEGVVAVSQMTAEEFKTARREMLKEDDC